MILNYSADQDQIAPIEEQSDVCDSINNYWTHNHGVQRRMISVDNFFVYLRFLIFALMLLYVT